MSSNWSRRYFLASSLALAGGIRAEEKVTPWLAPGDEGYEEARQPFNSVVKLKPALIAPCTSEQEVAEAVRHAAAKQLPVAVKSGGHAFHGYSLNEGGMVIHLTGMSSTSYKPATQHFTSGPGIKLRDGYKALLKHGRFLPAGSCGGVGLSGLTLGGGYGLFSREFGLTCDHLERVKMIDGKGQLRDSDEDPDLLWACRGGGNGNFGVITSMRFKTQAAPRTLASWNLRSRGNDAASFVKGMKAWFEVTANLPKPIFAALVLNGTQATVLLTSTRKSTGPAFTKAGKQLLAAGFSAGGPVDRAFATAIKRYEGRPGPLPFDNVSAGYYRGIESIESVADQIAATVIGTPGLIFQVNTLGGAITTGPDAAYPHREFPYLGELQAYWAKGAIPERLAAGHAKVRLLLQEAGITRHYRNYPDPRMERWEQAYFGANYQRLQSLKKRYDPDNRFQHPQSVRPA